MSTEKNIFSTYKKIFSLHSNDFLKLKCINVLQESSHEPIENLQEKNKNACLLFHFFSSSSNQIKCLQGTKI